MTRAALAISCKCTMGRPIPRIPFGAASGGLPGAKWEGRSRAARSSASSPPAWLATAPHMLVIDHDHICVGAFTYIVYEC